MEREGAPLMLSVSTAFSVSLAILLESTWPGRYIKPEEGGTYRVHSTPVPSSRASCMVNHADWPVLAIRATLRVDPITKNRQASSPFVLLGCSTADRSESGM